MTTIDRTAGALTGKVRDQLAARITSGELASGEQLPTERELSESFGVSRVTVRRALGALNTAGLIYAIQGRGTFVASEPLAEPPNVLLSFHDLAAGDKVVVGAEVIESDVRAASITEAEDFEIAPGAELVTLERLRTLDGLPVAIDLTRMPLALEPKLLELDWTNASLYATLSAAGHTPVEADYSVEALPADERSASLLATHVGAALLVAESRAYDAEGRLIVSGCISYRGDRYRFRSRLTADQQRPTGKARRRMI